jgi:hypothetical protein
MAQVEFPSGPDDTSVSAVNYYIHATGGSADPGTVTVRLVVAGAGSTVVNDIESRITTTRVAELFEDFAKAVTTELDAQPSSTVTLNRQYEGSASTDEEPVSF